MYTNHTQHTEEKKRLNFILLFSSENRSTGLDQRVLGQQIKRVTDPLYSAVPDVHRQASLSVAVTGNHTGTPQYSVSWAYKLEGQNDPHCNLFAFICDKAALPTGTESGRVKTPRGKQHSGVRESTQAV